MNLVIQHIYLILIVKDRGILRLERCLLNLDASARAFSRRLHRKHPWLSC